jgi:hypothetical protein
LIFPYCVLRVTEKSLKKTQSLSPAVKINLEFWKRNKDVSSQSLFNIYLSKSKPTKINKKKKQELIIFIKKLNQNCLMVI